MNVKYKDSFFKFLYETGVLDWNLTDWFDSSVHVTGKDFEPLTIATKTDVFT